MRRIAVALVCVLLVTCCRVLSADVDLVVRPSVRTHTEHITKSPHTFTVRADAEALRPFSRLSIPDDVLQWVKIEGAARNPKLLVDGLPDLSSADALFRSVIRPGMTDAQKALAVHTVVARFAVYTSSPARSTWGMDDPIIGLNCGAGICGNFTVWAKGLARRLGLPARTFELTRHTVPEIFYDGRWHMFDPTTRTFFVGRDNRTVASVRELEGHPELLTRGGASRRNLSYYIPPGNNRLGGHNERTGWRMDVSLRPGETLTRKTSQDGPSLWNFEINRNKRYASGSLVYKPDLHRGNLDELLKARANLTRRGDTFPALRPKVPGVPAIATFRVASPYPITKATLTGAFGRCAGASTFEVFITASAPGMTTWRRRVLKLDETGPGDHTLDLTPFVFGAYSYDVEFQMTSTAAHEPTGIDTLTFENTLHLNRYALPQLTGGENRVTYTDDGDARDVTVAFNLEEKHPLRPTRWPPMAGRKNTLRAFVRNAGKDPARNVEVLFEQRWRRDPLKKTVVIDRIEPGAVGVAEIDWTPRAARSTWFRITADPAGKIAETDEKNNVYTRGLRVLGAADLSVRPSQITVEKQGGMAHLEALIINTGGLAARDVEVAFVTGDGDTGEVVARANVPVVHSRAFTSGSIDTHGWAKAEVPAGKLTGTHVGVRIDPGKKLDDARRTNNTAWVEAARAGRTAPPRAVTHPDPLVFFSFEPGAGRLRDAEVHGTLEAREVSRHATHGKQALELTFGADTDAALVIPYDGVDVPMPRDWSRYRFFAFDVFSEPKADSALTVTLTTLGRDGTRVVHETSFRIRTGLVILPLDRLRGANLRAVEELRFTGKGTFHMDNLCLVSERGNPNAVSHTLTDIRPRTLPRNTTVRARPVGLSSRDDLAFFTGVRDVEISDQFGAPGRKRGAKFTVREGRSIGATLRLTRVDSPWPTDWRKYRRLVFHGRRQSDQPFAVSLKLRSSHPERGVKYVSRSFALRTDGARYHVDLDEIANRIDLDAMTAVTWFVWRPTFNGTFWLGGLALEQ